MYAKQMSAVLGPLLLSFSFQNCPSAFEPSVPIKSTTAEMLEEYCKNIEEGKDFDRVYRIPNDSMEELSEEELLQEAAAGNAGAQCRVGRKFHLFGGSRAQEWRRWLEMAAAQDYLDAQYNLGVILHERGDVAGIQWLEMAAEKGDPDALYKLGRIYYLGHRTAQDHGQALKCFRDLAEKGQPEGQFHLGVMYYKGESVPQDFVLAHNWINLAASRTTGDEADRARRLRDRVAEAMTREQIAEAQRIARQWKPK